MRRPAHPLLRSALGLLTVALVAAGCGSGGSAASSATSAGSTTTSLPTSGSTGPSGSTDAGTSTTSSSAVAGGEVTLVTHDSFAVDKTLLAAFEKSSGITVKLLAQGDAGALTNKLVLTKDNPIGDVVYGIDNTFASRALDAGVLQPYTAPDAANGADDYAIDDTHRLTAVDYGDVCVNVDHTWFKNKGLAEPTSYEDLAKPEYKDLLAVESPATSSPGLAFLLGTVSHFGADNWQSYWTSLKDNGVKVDAGWTDAYTVDFSGSSGKGSRPLVVSYASSPPDEVKDGDTTAPTGALLDTCFRQVEYTGVLTGAKNPAAAQQVVNWLLSKDFQSGMPEQMYVYPVTEGVALPASWKQFAPVALHPATMTPEQISAGRDGWVSDWTDLVQG